MSREIDAMPFLETSVTPSRFITIASVTRDTRIVNNHKELVGAQMARSEKATRIMKRTYGWRVKLGKKNRNFLKILTHPEN